MTLVEGSPDTAKPRLSTCSHRYVRLSRSGSCEPVPSSVKLPPSLTLEGVTVATATGGPFRLATLTLAVANLLVPHAVTVNFHTMAAPPTSTGGAVNER